MTLTIENTPTSTTHTTLHLTQIVVPYEDAVRTLRVRDSYDWHQRVWQAFAGRDGASRNFLVRIDRQDDSYRVLLLSKTPPTRPTWCPVEWFGTKLIPDQYFAHGRYLFSLVANPTKKLRVDNADGSRKRNGRRVPITQREGLLDWLRRKGDAGGFRVDSDVIRIIPKGRAEFQKGPFHGHHSAVEFHGELAVTDPALFRAVVISGIGSAKAFGFGLLVIAPIA